MLQATAEAIQSSENLWDDHDQSTTMVIDPLVFGIRDGEALAR